MSEQTNIEWCDSTFNPWTGCTKVSPGCDNCYAEGWAKRSGTVHWGPHAERRRTSVANWKQPLRWEREHEAFAAQHGRRRRVFCASLADVFDNAVPAQWRLDLFRLIADTPHLDWLLVTKRIGNVAGMLAELATASGGGSAPMPNIWLGITVVNQTEADRDIPKLLHVPAVVRFLSCEPLIGPLDLGREHRTTWLHLLDWVIVGGESGPKARPMHPQWPRDLRDQCAAAGTAFLFKQWGEWAPRSAFCHSLADGTSFADLDPSARRWPCVRLTERGHDGRDLAHAGEGGDAYMQKVGRALAGRLLEGVEHNGFPQGTPGQP